MMLRNLFFVVTSAFVFLASTPSFAETVLVTVTGNSPITGESTSKSNSFTFAATGFKYTITAAAPGGATGGAGAGKGATVTPITIFKNIDLNSPALFQAAFTGSEFPSVEMQFYHQVNATAADKPYYRITLTNAVISSLNQGDYKSGVPMEAVAFTAQKIQVEDPTTGGTSGVTTSGSWNIEQNSND